jgi:nucleotidyltransferase substrate binding protein (TIGR01987 family)
MPPQDIRWIQRFDNFNHAFGQLSDAVQLSKERKLSQLEKQGCIQAFEYTHELAWNVLKDFLDSRGVKTIGSKDATREAFKADLIKNGDIWMAMIKSRNQTSHTYNESVAEEIFTNILNSYFMEFSLFQENFLKLRESEHL